MQLMLDGLPERVGVAELFIRVSYLAALLGDAHTSVSPPEELRSCFKLPIVVENDSIHFAASAFEVPAGARLERIGARPAAEMLGWLRGLVSAETASGRDGLVPHMLPAALIALGYRDQLPLQVRLGDGRLLDVGIPARTPPRPRPNAIELRALDDHLVYLGLRTLVGEYEGSFATAFEDFFERVSSDRARGLIVDLRDNDGGSTAVADLLLSRLTERSYRFTSEKRWRVSAPMKERFEAVVTPEALAYRNSPTGSTSIERFEPRPPPAVRHRFNGPTVFLIGPGTLSAAMMLADAVQTYRLAFLVGEPTSTPPNFFGETYSYAMPHSGLSATISTALFGRANGDLESEQTVQPDFYAPTRLSDRLEGRDPAVAIATAVIERWHRLRDRP